MDGLHHGLSSGAFQNTGIILYFLTRLFVKMGYFMSETLAKDQITTMQRLARLYLTSEESLSLSQDLAKVLSWVGQLEGVCVRGMPDSEQPAMALREDGVTEGDHVALVLSNAPCPKDSFFTVPKVLKS
jgi:aspartyl-tRNA(Asn)/glutamyl-tRNA(Gln) amidotransferase subunit C